MSRCTHGWKLFIAWCQANEVAMVRLQTDHPEFTREEIQRAKDNDEDVKRTFETYMHHFRSCRTCIESLHMLPK